MVGTRLGSAFYEFTGDNTQLLGAFVQSETKARQASAAIQAAVKAQTAAIQSGSAAAQQAAAQQVKAAQGAIQAAQQAQQRYESMAKTLKAWSDEASVSFGSLLKSGVALGAGFAGVQLGAAGVYAAVSKVTEVTQAASQAQFQLDAT